MNVACVLGILLLFPCSNIYVARLFSHFLKFFDCIFKIIFSTMRSNGLLELTRGQRELLKQFYLYIYIIFFRGKFLICVQHYLFIKISHIIF